MALPKLNEVPKYELTIPSNGEKVKFRPYLVKEEKVLMLAAESKDTNQMLNAVMDTIEACVQTTLDFKKLTTFDIEYLFIKLRSKSVGEHSNITLSCSSCEHHNEVSIDLEQIECRGIAKDKFIKLDDKITVEMRYPSYKDISISENDKEMGFRVLASSLNAVITEDERIEIEDESPESVRAFLESMTKEQFEKVSSFLMDMPQVEHTVEFDCSKCNEHNKIDLIGLQSFF